MPKTIVSAAELAAHPKWRIFDCSHEISDPDAGRVAYLREHISGALHAKMEDVLSAPRTGENGRNPMCDPKDLAAWLSKAGLKNDDQIVVYDRGNGVAAARMWWALRWLGHDDVALLDGGLKAWKSAGHPVTDEIPVFERTEFTGRPDMDRIVDVNFVEGQIEAPDHLLVDARPVTKFRGIDETTDPRGGHIPGASSRPSSDNLDENGFFKPAERLREEWGAVLGSTDPNRVIAYCGSGVSACHNLLAMELAGFSGAKLYPGSWSEWCSAPARPIETE